jgi:hypothetical protein
MKVLARVLNRKEGEQAILEQWICQWNDQSKGPKTTICWRYMNGYWYNDNGGAVGNGWRQEFAMHTITKESLWQEGLWLVQAWRRQGVGFGYNVGRQSFESEEML